jgi:6-pyruvoyltetrahydropterin/6-carboxytetrahydropterin synthase
MPSAFLTRTVRFAAAHRYRRPEWDDRRNTEVFGQCARPHFHGHTYTCAVTVEGSVDPVTGMMVDLRVLDDVLRREVVERFDHRNINLEVPEFAEGRQVPTGENLAQFIFERVQGALGAGAVVSEVTIAEDDTLRVSVRSV